MIKRCKVFALVVFAFLIIMPGVFAALNSSLTETERVNLAYDCLEEKIDDRGCSSLSFEEKAFSLLSTGKCKTQLIDHSRSEECWPKERCTIIGTSKALLALDKVGQSMEKAEDWILARKTVPRDMIWYLQIDTEGESSCKIKYDGREYPINFAEDKTVDVSAGSCLLKQDSPFWLNIAPTCYEKEFEITCDKDYISSFLFREKGSKTIHVSSRVTSRAADSKALEQIKSFCFGESGTCDYESSLWATIVLGQLGHDISNYAPYLITGADINKEIFSAPFLYLITADPEYETATLERQINNQYWQENTGKYYDTALALLPFTNKENSQKTGAIEWLFDVQGDDGCWDNGNIRNNAFLLYSIWPRYVTSVSGGGSSEEPTEPDNDCELSNYDCVMPISCELTDRLDEYSCSGYSVCCAPQSPSEPVEPEETCSSINGKICTEDQYCSLGIERYTDDLASFEICCVGGSCVKKSIETPIDVPSTEEPTETEYTCESIGGGVCELSGCQEGYTISSYTCPGYADCCVLDNGGKSDKKSYWWLWVLIILIILTVVGIIYKDEIQEYIENLMDKDKDKDKKPGRPGFPSPGVPSYMKHIPPTGMPQRKIIPRPMPSQQPAQITQPNVRPAQTQNQLPQRPMATGRKPLPKTKTPKELDEVLRKLKEISK